MSALDKIRIAGFKSIRDQTVELRALNVLIGANGAGKSNFIGVFRLLNDIVRQNLQLSVGLSGGASRILRLGSKITPTLKLDFYFGKKTYTCHLSHTSDDGLAFSFENASFFGEGFSDLGAGHRETRILQKVAEKGPGSIPGQILSGIESWKVFHFHDTSAEARVKRTTQIYDNHSLRSDAANLAAFLFMLRGVHPHYYRQIVDVIRLAAPFFRDFVLRPNPLNPETLRLEWQEASVDDFYFDVSSMSDGLLRFICLATLLLQPDLPSTILIDEPELGLHPYAVNLLVDLVRGAASRTQVILCTQSAAIVDQVDPEDIVLVEREGGESTFRRPARERLASWLEDYSLGELWQKNVLSAVGK